MALVAGACLVTLPTFEAGAALELMERERCTLVSGNDTLFQMLMGHADFPRRRLSLRGGWAAAGPQTMRAIIDVLGAKHICAAYGLSEASPNVVMSDWRDAESLRIEGLALPHEGVQLRVAPDGEIQVKGWNVMRGYINNPRRARRRSPPTAGCAPATWASSPPTAVRMAGRLKDVFGRRRERRAGRSGRVAARPSRGRDRAGMGVPDARLERCRAPHVTLKSVLKFRKFSWLMVQDQIGQLPRAPLPGSSRTFEAIGMTASGKVQKTKLREHALRDFKLA
jgi:fatty-acyl-CoA synthase